MDKAGKIAALVKGLRQSCNMKAETLSDLSGLSLRTIERVESGKHAPNQQTLNLIAKALGVDACIFEEEFWENFQKSLEDAAKHKMLVPIQRIEGTKSVLDWIKPYHASSYNLEIADKDEEALEIAISFVELMRETCEISEDIPAGGVHECAKEIAAISIKLADAGYQIKIGSYTAQQKSAKAKPLIFNTLLMLVVPKDNKMEFALVTHQDGWENTEGTQKSMMQMASK